MGSSVGVAVGLVGMAVGRAVGLVGMAVGLLDGPDGLRVGEILRALLWGGIGEIYQIPTVGLGLGVLIGVVVAARLGYFGPTLNPESCFLYTLPLVGYIVGMKTFVGTDDLA